MVTCTMRRFVLQKPGSAHHQHRSLPRTAAHTVEHDGRRLADDADVPRLLAQLAHGGLLGGLACVDEARGHLDGDLVDGRAVLLLQDDLGTGGPVEDGDDADAVDLAARGPGAALGRLPGAVLPVGVLVGELDELDPGGLAVGLGGIELGCGREEVVTYQRACG